MYEDIIDNWYDLEIWNEDHTVMLSWEWLGEGLSGDWEPDDPDDYPHLRFSIYKFLYNETVEVDNSSYCTSLPITVSPQILEKLAKYILNIVEDKVKGDISIKRICEELSWLNEEDLNNLQ